MKIVAINGSPRGKASNTNIMVTSFLKGAQESGAEITNVFLAEKDIKYCKGCLSCRINHGQCMINDDMAEILSLENGADVLLLATPLYVHEISGTLKVYMDRRLMNAKGQGYMEKDATGEYRGVETTEIQIPKLVMMSNCFNTGRYQFQVISLWIQRTALGMHTEVIGEIYAPQGALLTSTNEKVQPIISNYLKLLEKAGKEISTDMSLSEETEKLLEKSFFPDELYIQGLNRQIDSMHK
jgi:putative NADPH-quinone reductase